MNTSGEKRMLRTCPHVDDLPENVGQHDRRPRRGRKHVPVFISDRCRTQVGEFAPTRFSVGMRGQVDVDEHFATEKPKRPRRSRP